MVTQKMVSSMQPMLHFFGITRSHIMADDSELWSCWRKIAHEEASKGGPVTAPELMDSPNCGL